MYSKGQIECLVNLIKDAVKPDKIILFGSYAYGSPTPNSDIDIMVVMEDENMSFDDKIEIKNKITQQRQGSPEWIASDISIVSQQDIEARKDDTDSAVYDAIRKGKILYEKIKTL